MGSKTNAAEQITAARMPQKGTTLRGKMNAEGYGLWGKGGKTNTTEQITAGMLWLIYIQTACKSKIPTVEAVGILGKNSSQHCS